MSAYDLNYVARLRGLKRNGLAGAYERQRARKVERREKGADKTGLSGVYCRARFKAKNRRRSDGLMVLSDL
ncbi:hypothetical protein HNV12_00995 [Methanococcoides sp. SA1]|nr:hypothetical protein [Methanococcoides sp. SA1]